MNQQSLNMVPITDVFCMPNEQEIVEQIEKPPMNIPMSMNDEEEAQDNVNAKNAQLMEDDTEGVIQQELQEMQTIDSNSGNIFPFNLRESFGDTEPIWTMIGLVTFGVIGLLLAGILFSKSFKSFKSYKFKK